MHIKQIAARLKPKSGKLRIALIIFFGAISLLGVYEFVKLNFVGYILKPAIWCVCAVIVVIDYIVFIKSAEKETALKKAVAAN